MDKKNLLRPYEISLWTLQDSFITVLKPFGLSHRGQIETPKCLIKNDGTQELSFKIPMYYRQEGKFIENPIWYNVINGSLIVNLRKLKLIFNKGLQGEEIFEFVISEVNETHTDGQLYCEITAEGLAFQELGKVGYKISLMSEDFKNEYYEWAEKDDYSSEEEKAAAEPKNNINYWCDKLFKNSNWKYEIQMDWSSYDGIIIDDISGEYIIPSKEGEEKISYEGTYQNAPKEIKEAFNKKREKNLRRLDRIYEEEYISSWETIGDPGEESLVPSNLEDFKEKLRLVDLEKSNTYNNSQELAKIFGVYCKYQYEYDENYHIIGKKCIFYNNFLSEKESNIDIIYPFDASKIERKIDSADVVTKMFVTPVEDSTSPSGLITIADVAANKMREDYILNFDYLYSIGTITEEQYNYIADYERSIYLINLSLEPLAMQIANLQNDLVTYEAQLTLSKESQILDKEQMEQSTALLDAITKSTGVLYKNLDTPYRGTLSPSPEKDDTYYIKITQEGVDVTGKIGYPLKNGDLQNIYGIRLYYYAKVTEEDNTIEKVLLPYEKEDLSFEGPIYPETITINKDEYGNIFSLSNIKLKENAASKNYFITFSYKPELQYQNIYDTYAKKLAADEAAEKEALAKIDEIKDKIEKLEEKYNILLEEKAVLIADFENMMGPALKEGSWQAENYNDYGSKYNQKVEVGITNNSHINFYWDTEAFDEEQLLYYEEGTEQEEVYYYGIILTNEILEKIKNNLTNLSFIYEKKETETSDFKMPGQMTIGSELAYSFIDLDDQKTPVLLLLDKTFKKDENFKYRLGLISSELTTEGVQTKIETFVELQDNDWVSLSDKTQYYPRLKVDSLLLKTSDDELVIKYNNNSLRNYYDYSILVRDENYFITLKNELMLRDGNLNKSFDISYAISNAALSLYLDALEVSKTNAFPQVSYTIEVSALNEKFIKYAYQKLNMVVNIHDADLKFENVYGYISELELDLENPWEDSITVQNYKTKFEDLFSTIVASSEQMKTNSFAYNNAASAFGPGGVLKPSIIQSSINQTDLTYAFNNGNLTIDEINGIWARSDAGVVAMRGGGIFCATETDSNGNWLWNTGIMPSGINASLITAGQIDTNLIKIYAGDDLRLQLNADGLFAYNVDSLGEADLDQYVVHNKDGLFSTIVDENGNKTNLVEVSWNGFILRDEKGNTVFNADKTGNLSIVGTITAKNGNIGNWLIKEDGLWSEDGSAGIITKVKLDDDGNIIEGSELYPMFWVTGQGENGKKFEVYSDGTVYANNIFLSGFISADSVIGNTSGDEISNQLRNIEISILEGSTFIFNNRNYDNNLITEPDWLYFRIKTHALTLKELTNSDYKFYYGLSKDGGVSIDWKDMPKDSNGVYNEKYLIWKPEYLTFTIKSDIMYLGLEDSLEPNTILYFKVEKLGKLKKVNSETGEISYNEDYIYFDTIQLNSEKHGIGKYITPMNPPSYTFIEDQNNEIQYADETTFSVELTGFDLEKDREELENSYWSINGIDCGLRTQLVSSLTEDNSADEPGAAVLISDDKEIIINGEKVEDPYYDETLEKMIYTIIDGRSINSIPGIDISLTVQEGKIIAAAVISNTIVPEGGNIVLSYHIGQASRSASCFKIRNGSDGINIVMRSSSGYTLTSGDMETELSIEVYYGMQQMNIENSEIKFYYVWKKDEEALSNINKINSIGIENPETLEITSDQEIIKVSIKNENGTANEDFFKLKSIYITALDFGKKSNYRCDVFTSREEALREYLLMNENRDENLEFE